MGIDKKIKYEDQRLTEKQKKKIKPANQGGGPNYLGKQETVTVPKKWLSDPDHVVAELAYITPQEQKILLEANLYGSLKGKPNRGPGGIMSLQGDLGGYDASPGGPNSGGDGGNRVGQTDQNKQRVQDILTGKVTTGQTVAPSDRVKAGAVPEFVGDKYVGSAYKSYGQPSFFGDLFSGGASGYRSTYGTQPGIFGSLLGRGNSISTVGTPGMPGFGYVSSDPRVGQTKPGFGGRFLGGLASLLTGVPLVGSVIGSAIDYGKGLFGPKDYVGYDDMSQYNKLQLIDGQVIDPTGLELDKGEFGFPVETGTEKTQMVPMKKPIKTNQTYTLEELIPYEETIPTKDYIPPYMAEVTQKDINASKMRGFNTMDYNTAIDLGMISPNVTEYEFEQLKQGNISEPGTYTI